MTYPRRVEFEDLSKLEKITVVATAIFLVGFLATGLYKLFKNYHEPVTVEKFEWSRTVNVETFKTSHYNNVRYLKQGSFNVRSWDDGHMVASFDSNGHFSGMDWEEDIKYEFDVNEWVPLTSYVATGNDQCPKWPTFTLATGPLGQLDRVGTTSELLTVHVVTQEEEKKFMHMEADVWKSFEIGEKVVAVENVFGTLLQLERATAEK